jgi:hypothetical protein
MRKLITFQFLNFVLFVTFVVKCLFRFWLRRSHAVKLDGASTSLLEFATQTKLFRKET